MRWLVLALGLVGCVNAELVECSDDRLCPRGTACDVVHHTCVAPDQLTVCEGEPDFTSCVATNVEEGRCFDGVCLPAGCGNDRLEPGELCDDGNTLGGDGCSADCQSKEVCGDGFADLRDEECDDGNQGGRDGCTNHCTLERPVWRLRLLDKPRARGEPAGAYDPLAGHLVVFGGVDVNNAFLDDTWGVDEVGWSTLYIGGPARRASQAMTWDRRARRVLMFGGDAGVLLDDTWEWDGATWTRRTSQVVPPARKNSALASDGTRVLMFGGSQLSDKLGDTWSWGPSQDGTTSWSRITTAAAPAPREKHAMVFDPKHDRFVLFGGSSPTVQNDTWIFDGTNWSQLVTATRPARMSWVALAYDARREVIVLSGVEASTSNNVVWELDGSTWTAKPTTVTPTISSGAVLAYDERRDRVVQYSGRKQSTPELRNEVWEWDGTQWTLRFDPQLPPPRQACALASDPVRGRVVMFGGQGASNQLGDTWEWNGRGWTQQIASGPSARVGAGLAFDGTEMVLFGGTNVSVFDETWRWNGQRWQQLAVPGPSARFAPAMAFDSKRGRVILFGGNTGTTYTADTWQWDGAAWSELTPVVSPPPRMEGRLVYDGLRDRIVLFGGVAPDGTTRLTDTWEFDGTTWADVSAMVSPAERSGFSLVYDRRRERTTLLGGLIASLSLWEWDGSTWTQPDSPVVPVVANGACATYDDARSEIVAFGGAFLGVTQQTATGSFRGDREEVCSTGEDLDGDGAAGCKDSDCRTVCAPLCWDVLGCTSNPRCGDGQCSTLEAEAGRACAADCGP